MTGKDILHIMKVKAGFAPPDTGKGKGKISKHITHGFHLMKGKSAHPMEDYLVSEFKQEKDRELGLFAIFDGHLGHDVASYLQNHLFQNILKEHDFWTETESAVKRAYLETDEKILEQALVLGRGGSTAVTAILIDGQKLIVANVGDSRAVICENGKARQLSKGQHLHVLKCWIFVCVDWANNIFKHFFNKLSLNRDVPRVDGQLAVARAFGDRSLKMHLSSEPDVLVEEVDPHTEFLILASDGIWKVMSNEEAVESIRQIKDAQAAAKHLIEEAIFIFFLGLNYQFLKINQLVL
uniref:protein-serine/threonine phosphatase n=2 Tax=Glycine max TaxID=3847 RepID=A0A368UI29_SOYBN